MLLRAFAGDADAGPGGAAVAASARPAAAAE
jgi:hypothetical protein